MARCLPPHTMHARDDSWRDPDVKQHVRTIGRVIRGRAPRVRLVSWSPPGERENFGDALSSVLVEEILLTRGLDLESSLPRYQVWRRPRRLLGLGSILHFARTGDTVWGSGINGKIDERAHTFEQLDVRLVRGPLTRERLLRRGIVVPERYGDPGLLVSRFLAERIGEPEERREWIFVPNLNDLGRFPDDAHTLSPLEDWERVCRVIRGAGLVVATSLHAVVVAEAFGVPARLVESFVEPPLKYLDYYLGTGRDGTGAAPSIGDALRLGGRPLPSPATDHIVEAFPLDLWS